MTQNKRTLASAAAAVAAALLLASCGGTGDGPAPEAADRSAAAFNGADVEFARMMIPHHRQAVEMSELARTRAGEDVRALAEEIEAAQGPEIDRMNGLLEAWGEDTGDTGDTGAEDHAGMDGMLSQEQMAELERAEGEAFDTLFLELMVLHHEGAVAMAETELEEGADPEARELAQEIVDAQRSEIELMDTMLGGAGGGDRDESSGSGEHGGH
ncbi:DUF305 domain-containing protein [Nocardiopsis sp. NPDC101807]|uniref:DUF305 domain-containing protein n=1 Tax=Nocardiopsis sp. NPDC101807 TaxID=3364339 RepID=UPI00382737E0